jgi:hypothetical protein
MKIRYNVSVDDMVYFNRFCFLESKRSQQILLKNKIFFTISLLFIMGCMSYQTKNWVTFIPIGICISILYVLQAKNMVLKKLENATRKTYSDKGDTEMTEEIEIEIQNDGIFVSDQDSAGKTEWDALTRVVRNENYALIFIGTNQAHVIRKASVLLGDLEPFLDEIEKKINEKNKQIEETESPAHS